MHVITLIDCDGDIRDLSLPSAVFDRAGLSAWSEWELGDKALADAIRYSQRTPTSLLIERYTQSARLLGLGDKEAGASKP